MGKRVGVLAFRETTRNSLEDCGILLITHPPGMLWGAKAVGFVCSWGLLGSNEIVTTVFTVSLCRGKVGGDKWMRFGRKRIFPITNTIIYDTVITTLLED